jgi:hypothetical protein
MSWAASCTTSASARTWSWCARRHAERDAAASGAPPACRSSNAPVENLHRSARSLFGESAICPRHTDCSPFQPATGKYVPCELRAYISPRDDLRALPGPAPRLRCARVRATPKDTTRSFLPMSTKGPMRPFLLAELLRRFRDKPHVGQHRHGLCVQPRPRRTYSQGKCPPGTSVLRGKQLCETRGGTYFDGGDYREVPAVRAR